MAQKKTLTDEELFAQFEDIPSASGATSTSNATAITSDLAASEDDPLAELSALAAARPTSRPTTPRVSSSTTSGTRRIETPAGSEPPSVRTSEEKQLRAGDGSIARKSTESIRNHHDVQSTPEQAKDVSSTPASQSGGWWGSVYSAASAAVKQAEAAVNEIRSNEEAQKWAEQVRGNVEKVKAYGDNVRSLAIPTFTNILETIAPPISAHERLMIHTTHDIIAYPSMDPLIYAVFARVMAQVEGGELLVIQRGSESRVRDRSSSEAAYRGSLLSSGASGWGDGPWWRESITRSLGSINGVEEAAKLCRANAEAYANEYLGARGGAEEAAKKATENLSESNPVRSSDIFLSIQAVSGLQDSQYFVTSPTSAEKPAEASTTESDNTAFLIYLSDPVHSISCNTLSQAFPTQWVRWFDAEPRKGEDGSSTTAIPDDDEAIQAIVASGGIDPREWAAEWLEEILSLAIGVVAQNYVAKRMGVGSGVISSRARVRAEEQSAGEAARAV